MTPNMLATMTWLREQGFTCTPGCRTCGKDTNMRYVDSLKNRETLIAYLKEHARVTLEALPEDEPPEDHLTPEDAAYAREQISLGNEWAWCTAKVTVSYNSFSATEYLGCCSYGSEAEFRSGGYYEDMVRVCCTDLVAQMVDARDTLDRAWTLANPSLTQNVATDSD